MTRLVSLFGGYCEYGDNDEDRIGGKSKSRLKEQTPEM